MHLRIFTIGKPRLAFARAGVAEYLERIPTRHGIELESLRASNRDEESTALLARSEGMVRVALDERGQLITSRDLARKFTRWEGNRTKGVAFLIGGADGHSEELRAKADWMWALSPLTFQHELALVILIEQLYRARCINAGSPYHRD
jgi:23S rRNA (pseudouridine1915-N3)-methyltransferase